MRALLKAAPSRPATAALTTMSGSCRAHSRSPKVRMPEKPIMPRWAERSSCAIVKVAATAARKQRHAVLRDQKLHASSIAKSTPPMGAPKAAEMPAAKPADTASRWSASPTRSSRTFMRSRSLASRSGRADRRPGKHAHRRPVRRHPHRA